VAGAWDIGDQSMLHVGVIGYGYWGPNLVRNFVESGRAQVTCVSDLNSARLALAKARYPGIEVSTDALEVIGNPALDALVIATPVSSHFDLAMAALKAGKHVLVEKPMTATSAQAVTLIEQANERRLSLMVDHTFVYTGAVRKIREIIAGGDLGQPYYFDSVRINLGLFQHDVNVIWDLAVHDLSILNYVLPGEPLAISATGASHVGGKTANIAYLTLFFAGNFIAHMHVNWLAPVKIRRTVIGGSRRMIVYDDLEGSEKVKVYDKGVNLDGNPEDLYRARINYRAGDMWAPNVEATEALKLEVDEFIDSIEQGRRPLTDGEAGLLVVRILEAATASMEQQGRLTELGKAQGAGA
jgi:predicted dehydrogenase